MAREQFQTLTEPMFYILLALREECCGVDIMERVTLLSHGRVRIGPGTLYTMLQKFEANNVISQTRFSGRQKWYIVTETGRRMLEEEIDRLKTMLLDANAFREV
ncbi:MAG: helix-turn-helix transcriptional regulator [Eubacterium sp.]|nr:helix-turn-helix transcriptional regulator [Eubacterium sp.]